MMAYGCVTAVAGTAAASRTIRTRPNRGCMMLPVREQGGTAVDVLQRLREPENVVDPYPLYAALREMSITTPRGEAVLARYADVTAVLADPRFGKVAFPKT